MPHLEVGWVLVPVDFLDDAQLPLPNHVLLSPPVVILILDGIWFDLFRQNVQLVDQAKLALLECFHLVLEPLQLLLLLFNRLLQLVQPLHDAARLLQVDHHLVDLLVLILAFSDDLLPQLALSVYQRVLHVVHV